ncbi:unnamed protein product [Lactuca virosa]|uniref:Auxin-repressed protein n=1 Tax=Lactuca virosa TaxID=75947 RepID=A0AAU9PEK7_9ASTR|nr:unnamed protein product [Lactuca virosa]
MGHVRSLTAQTLKGTDVHTAPPALRGSDMLASVFATKIKQPEAMVLIDQMWDEVVAGPQPQRGLGKLRKVTTVNEKEGSSKFQKSLSMPPTPTTPGTPTTPSPTAARKDNVWRSVFNPGSNLATKSVGSNYFDNPSTAGSPTVYDWLYSGETRSKHR